MRCGGWDSGPLAAHFLEGNQIPSGVHIGERLLDRGDALGGGPPAGCQRIFDGSDGEAATLLFREKLGQLRSQLIGQINGDGHGSPFPIPYEHFCGRHPIAGRGSAHPS